MNFTKLIFPAALAGAILMNAAAQAQSTDATKKLQGVIDAWADNIKQIVDTGHGEKRRNELKVRTDQLNADVQGMPCTFSDRGSYENRVENAGKARSITVKATFDCNRDNKTESKISFIDVATSLYEDDIAYNLAVVSNASITKWISDWASEEKKAIDETSDLGARAGKVTEIASAYRAKFQNTRCHPAIALNISNLTEDARKSRALPIQLDTSVSCKDYRLDVATFSATLNIKAENDNAKRKPTFGADDFTWNRAASGDMFPTADKLATNADRATYAAKFGPHGTFHDVLNTIRCTDYSAVTSGFPAKVRGLQSAVKFSELKVSCAPDGAHLVVSVHAEPVKTNK
jgi:hypothetical protein